MIHKIVKLTLNLLLVLATGFAGNSAIAQSRINILAADSINSFRSVANADTIVFNPALTYGTLTDIDGNIYKTITIGKQTWMAENLKTTHFNDKTKIPNETNSLAWPTLTTPAYCWYNNDSVAYKATYGALYNWQAANTAKLAPVGWHVSSEGEWVTLANYLIANGYNYDGNTVNQKYAKSLASAAGWPPSTSPGSVGKTDFPEKRNATGFTAMPGGMLNSSGTFSYVSNFGFWWTSTDQSDKLAWSEYMFTNYVTVIPGNDMKSCGFSVRCMKDSVSTTEVKPLDSKAGSNLAIYPNPVISELHISFETPKSGEVQAEIIDLLGKVLYRQIINSQNGTNRVSIPVIKLPTGLYLFRLQTCNQSETIKFYKR
jgi:uncharacterized protein (TIGR02145 family)